MSDVFNLTFSEVQTQYITAYDYAVKKGYTGTEDEFAQLMADYAGVGERSAQSKEDAEAYAVGQRNGETVSPSDVTYENNAKYFSDLISGAVGDAQSYAESAEDFKDAASGFADDASESALASKDYAEQAAQSAADIAHKADIQDLYDMLPTDTVSGSIASFPDGADGVPIKTLKVGVEPAQDLHGYDKPWPAGGGKNKLNASDKTLSAAGYLLGSQSEASPISLPAGQYTLSFNFTGTQASNNYIRVKLQNGSTEVLNATTSANATKYTFTIASDATGIVLYSYNSNGGTWKNFQIEAGAAQTDYAPYSNICPITGWTGANVVRTGKNVISGYIPLALSLREASVYLGGLDGTIAGTTVYFPCKAGVTYVRTILSGSTANRGYWAAFDHMPQPKDDSSDILNNTATFTPTVTGIGCLYIKNEVDDTLINYTQIEVGTVATDYETPKENVIYPISWETEAGTVYGGTLDVGTGELVVDRQIVDLGTLTWTKYVDDSVASKRYFYASPTSGGGGQAKGVPNGTIANDISSRFTTDTYGAVCGSAATGYKFNIANTTRLVYVHDDDHVDSDAATFKTAMDGVQLVYKIATPITITLTPTQITTLLGTNNIFADTGDVDVTYRADIKRYVDKKIAELTG